MNDLSSLLTEAAEAEPSTFDHADIERRFRRRARGRRLVSLAATVVIVAVGLVLAEPWASPEETGLATDADGRSLAEELTADRWVLRAYSGVATISGSPFVDLRADGTIAAFGDGCLAGGRWSIEGDTLVTRELEVPGTPDEPDGPCALEDSPLTRVVAADPAIEEIDPSGGLGSLRLVDGEEWVSLERFDRLGPEPTRDDLVGAYEVESSVVDDAPELRLELDGDGTATIVSVSPFGEGDRCELVTGWSLDGDRLGFADDPADGLPCEDGSGADGRLFTPLLSDQRVRLDAGRLWLSTRALGVVTLVAEGG